MKKNRKNQIQKNRNAGIKTPSILFFSFKNNTLKKPEVMTVGSFDKVVVSPHIQAVFKQGNHESVTIEELTIASNKMNVEVTNNVLKIFLHQAEAEVNLDSKESINWDDKSVYKGTIAKIVVTYKDLGKVALVGEEKFTFLDKIQQKDMRFKLIGRNKIFIKEAEIQNLDITSYGKNYLEVSSGKIPYQNITAFGEDELDLSKVLNEVTDIKSFGNGKFSLQVAEQLNVTSMGNAHITYKGNAKVSKGIMLGDSSIEHR